MLKTFNLVDDPVTCEGKMNLIGIRGSNTQNHTAVYGTAIKNLDDVKL